MSYSLQHDIGSRLVAKLMRGDSTQAAAGSTNTTVGTEIDRRPVAGNFTDLYQSCKIVVRAGFETTVHTTGDTANIKWKLQHSSSTSNTAFSDFADIDGTTQQTLNLGKTTSTAQSERIQTADFRLDTAKRYIRLEIAESTNGSTIGIRYDAIGFFGPGDAPPAN